MIEIGKHNTLTILRTTSVGLYLGDEEGEDVLLPNKYCPETYDIGDELEVFVYHDHEERKVATNIHPKILMNEFAFLKVTDVNNVGAFLDWGLEKELLVPFREQRLKMETGRWYIVYMDIDEKTGRLYASNKIEKRLQNEDLTVKVGQEVDLLIYKQTDLGYSVIINHIHKGLVFENEVFQEIRIGQKMKGFVKKIRENNNIDISLQAVGDPKSYDKISQMIFDSLKENDGFLPLSDKSLPGDIYNEFGISKKAFKKAIGALYKKRKISIDSGGIRLI